MEKITRHKIESNKNVCHAHGAINPHGSLKQNKTICVNTPQNRSQFPSHLHCKKKEKQELMPVVLKCSEYDRF